MSRSSDEGKPRSQARDGRDADRSSGESIEIAPEEVIQKDRRPWRRITLEGVVVRTIAASAVAMALFALLSIAVLRIFRII